MDLFEHYETLPQNVLDVLSKHGDGDFTYTDCEALKTDLEAIGYTCDYGLDATPYELRKLSKFDEWSTEMVDKVFNAILDEMSNIEAEDLNNEVTTQQEKIRYFIVQEERFESYFL